MELTPLAGWVGDESQALKLSTDATSKTYNDCVHSRIHQDAKEKRCGCKQFMF
jgi:hypothetical protein